MDKAGEMMRGFGMHTPRPRGAVETAALQGDPRAVARLQRQYLEHIQPYLQMRANLLAVQPVRYVVTGLPEGWSIGQAVPDAACFTQEIMWDRGAKRLFDQLGEEIDTIRASYYIPGGEL